ncbi:MAG: dephospho-CoA kinase [bacterium]|nr:dephospho-CoA kinase [bacterium]
MLIIGLTGSIAMGKSTAGDYLVQRGIPLFNADDVVHELYRKEAVESVGAVFPGAIVDHRVDRTKLSELLINDPEKIRLLEAIVHPLVIEKRLAFIEKHRLRGTKMIVVDIPLLFEKQLQNGVDVILVMTAPPEVQEERVIKRPGMTAEKFAMIHAHQMDDEQKRQLADFVIDTDGPLEQTYKRLDSFLESLHDWPQKMQDTRTQNLVERT